MPAPRTDVAAARSHPRRVAPPPIAPRRRARWPPARVGRPVAAPVARHARRCPPRSPRARHPRRSPAVAGQPSGLRAAAPAGHDADRAGARAQRPARRRGRAVPRHPDQRGDEQRPRRATAPASIPPRPNTRRAGPPRPARRHRPPCRCPPAARPATAEPGSRANWPLVNQATTGTGTRPQPAHRTGRPTPGPTATGAARRTGDHGGVSANGRPWPAERAPAQRPAVSGDRERAGGPGGHAEPAYQFDKRSPAGLDLPAAPAGRRSGTPPWLADDLPQEPPMLRLVEPPPLADRALRDQANPTPPPPRRALDGPPLRLVDRRTRPQRPAHPLRPAAPPSPAPRRSPTRATATC